MYHHPPYRELGRPEEFPAAEYWFGHAVYLPFGMALDETDAERIGQEVACLDDLLVDPPSAVSLG